jgi:large subunit ribosomal protein L24
VNPLKIKTKKPGKQRKRLYKAPQHKIGKIMSAHLSSELQASHNTRSLPVITGDNVRVYRGDYKGFEGRVTSVDRKGYGVFVDGINREKADGTQIPVPIHPSKLEIMRLNLNDKWRKRILERKSSVEERQIVPEETVNVQEPSKEINDAKGE